MSVMILYSLLGIAIFIVGLCGVILFDHLLRKVLGINLMGTGIFMFLIAISMNPSGGEADPVPHAMVLTGIVVAVSATALLLSLIVRLHAVTDSCRLEDIINQLNQKHIDDSD